jgi:hypothetical protein
MTSKKLAAINRITRILDLIRAGDLTYTSIAKHEGVDARYVSEVARKHGIYKRLKQEEVKG